MNENQLVKTIKALITKADYASEKADQFYIAAGQHLQTLKNQCPSSLAWEELVRRKCGLGKTRAYELLQIADGRKSVEKVRADTAERTSKSLKKLKAASANSGEPEPEQECEPTIPRGALNRALRAGLITADLSEAIK